MYHGDQEHDDRSWTQPPPDTEDANRRRAERRIQESRGYTYISMVGWMDRREKKRREDDDKFLW
jgi:hypothetical protein